MQLHSDLDIRQTRILFNNFLLNSAVVKYSSNSIINYVYVVKYIQHHPNVRISFVNWLYGKKPSITVNKTSDLPKQKIELCADYFPSRHSRTDGKVNMIYGPYPSFPTESPREFFRQAHYHQSRRYNCMAIVGNYSVGYQNDLISDLGYCDRWGVYMHLMQNYSVEVCTSVDEAISFLDSQDKFCILRIERINPKEYIDLIARFRYVLCCPGVMIPVTHTLYEVGYVGSIPITNIGMWLGFDFNEIFQEFAFKTYSDLDMLLESINEIDSFLYEARRELFIRLYNTYSNGAIGASKVLKGQVKIVSTVSETKRYYNFLNSRERV